MPPYAKAKSNFETEQQAHFQSDTNFGAHAKANMKGTE